MAEKNKNLRVGSGKSTVQLITNSLNKHGEIRGESKKETKNLKAMCPHHKMTKKGKIKPTVYNDGNGTCTCEMCGHSFTTHLYGNDEVKKSVGEIVQLLDQSRYMAEAADLGKETKAYLAQTSVSMSHFPKTYKKIRKVIEKTENTKRKKNKNRNQRGGSESYGGWR